MPEFDEIPAYLKEMMITVTGQMTREAEKAVLTLDQFIDRALRTGMNLDEVEVMLLRDLKEGGQIFGDFRKAFKSHVHYGIEESARGELVDNFADIKLWEWLGIADGKICPDCLTRHNGESKTYDEWQRIGLPGSGATICQANCRCTLIPSGSIQKPDGGIVRKK